MIHHFEEKQRQYPEVWQSILTRVGADKLIRIGSGTEGVVYDIGNGKILKMTCSDRELETASYLKEHESSKLFAPVYSSFKEGAFRCIVSKKMRPLRNGSRWRDFIDEACLYEPHRILSFWKGKDCPYKEQLDWVKTFHIYCEEQGYKFTDIHAGNLMEDEFGNVCLIDFGYSRVG